MRKDTPMKRMAMLLAAMTLSNAMAQQIEISVPEPAQVRLDWQAIPGQTYRVMSTTNLLLHLWQDAQPSGFLAESVIGTYTQRITGAVRFFRLQKEDTSPPEVVSRVPDAESIAVLSNQVVAISMTDETGVDPTSILLSVAGWTNMSLSSPFVTYADGHLSFDPDESLGNEGDSIGCALTVSDTLGNTLDNLTWSFQLARQTAATNDFLPLIAPPEGQSSPFRAAGVQETRVRTLANVKPFDASGSYEIVSVTSNSVVFSYDGTPPDMPVGKRLVSFDAAHPFYREAVSYKLNGIQSQMTVWTEDIALTDLAVAGSLSSASFIAADPALHVKATASDLNLLHVEFGDDLSGTVLFEDSGLKLHLPQASWGFVGDVDVAFDLFFAELRSLDASAKGTLTLDISPEAVFYQAVNGDGEFPLVEPVTKLFGAMIGPVPVWVEVIMELNAGYEYSATVSGVVNTSVHAEKELTFSVKLRQNQWTHGVENPPIVLRSDPIYWQLQGDANAKVYVQPKLTVLVYSLAGLWADVRPYAEFEGWYQLNPVEYDLALYLGVSSTLGIESRIWYPAWGSKPEWSLFDEKWPLWRDVYPDWSAGAAPSFLPHQNSVSVDVLQPVTLDCPATGDPAPVYTWYFNGQRIPGIQGPSYHIGSANPLHAGNYQVRAQNSLGHADSTVTLDIDVPVPANVRATKGTLPPSLPNMVFVTWDGTPRATGYSVYKTPTVGGSKTLLGRWSGSHLYDDTIDDWRPGLIHRNVPVNQTNYYCVVAEYGSISSGYSSSDAGWHTTPYTVVTSPNGGEVWTIGSTQTITWTSANIPEDRYINLFKDGESISTLANGIPDTGNFSWTIGTWLEPGSTYQIQVFGWADDLSDAWFSLVYPVPHGTIASKGAFQDHVKVVWQEIPFATGYNIYRALSAGGERTFLDDWDGIYSYNQEVDDWTPGYRDYSTEDGATNFYWIAATFEHGLSGFSDPDFGWKAGVPSTTVTSPNGGEVWTIGSTQTITWTSANIPGDRYINLFKDGESISTLANGIPDTGNFSWTIGTWLEPGSTYQIQVFGWADDLSDGYFTLAAP